VSVSHMRRLGNRFRSVARRCLRVPDAEVMQRSFVARLPRKESRQPWSREMAWLSYSCRNLTTRNVKPCLPSRDARCGHMCWTPKYDAATRIPQHFLARVSRALSQRPAPRPGTQNHNKHLRHCSHARCLYPRTPDPPKTFTA
jgi:hypothetical protein